MVIKKNIWSSKKIYGHQKKNMFIKVKIWSLNKKYVRRARLKDFTDLVLQLDLFRFLRKMVSKTNLFYLFWSVVFIPMRF